jgi:tRNA-dihydrouridine synthase A
MNPHRFCVAPMIDWTDRHFRFLFRLISRHARLYTEMLTWQAIVYGDQDRLLAFDASEHPLACQLGGADPKQLAKAAKIAAQYGYDEINLNIGCPSDRVQQGEFGACLMQSPQRVADCVAAIRAECDLPVTIKTRTGIDHQDSWEFLLDFVGPQIEQGVATIMVHARKAWLSGLSPKQNREIPPLEYEKVYRLKRSFPNTAIILNGGLNNLDAVQHHLQSIDQVQLDGVMLGRACYQHPYQFAPIDQQLFADNSPTLTPLEIVDAYQVYAEQQLQQGVRLHSMTRHLLNLFQNCPGARQWRRHLSEQAPKRPNDIKVIEEAKKFIRQRD